MPRDIYDDIERALIDQQTLLARIDQLAAAIEADYQAIDDLLLLGVLKGSVVFMTELSMRLRRPHQIDFLAVSSYGASTQSSGVVQIRLDLKENISGRDVLIVEDIIDSGNTLSYLRRMLLARQPASLRICTLLNKPSRRTVDVPVDYIGFDIPDEFVVGFGLDYGELYRNVPYIAVLKPTVFGGA